MRRRDAEENGPPLAGRNPSVGTHGSAHAVRRDGERGARGRSIVSRVVWGTVLAALLSCLGLAATAASVSRVLWRAREERALEETAAALLHTLRMEAEEDGSTIEESAPGALAESALAGYHVEIWKQGALVVMSPPGPVLGPSAPPVPRAAPVSTGETAPSALPRSSPPRGWLIRTQELPEGLTLILALPEEYRVRALRVFGLSLLLSAPPCLLLAIVVGRLVGRRATRPLAAFTERVSRVHELRRLEVSASRRLPAEVYDLEASFRSLLSRLMETLARELEFAADASHELRTPLTTIRLHAERARESAAPAARCELDELIREIDRMARLVDSLLVLASDAEAGIPMGEVVNLADITRDLARRTFDDAQSRPELALPDEALVRGDESLLSIAVENLLDNARKFTPRGLHGQVQILAARGRLTLAVSSPGVRIADGERERLFERFYRGPEARAGHEGHGLGLSLARHIARLHGGDVRCVSGPAEDARFALDLPAWRSRAAD